jgi:hypothetical protein
LILRGVVLPAAVCLFAMKANAVTTVVLPASDPQVRTVTAGPNRIICNASFCQLGSGARPRERFRIIVSGLPQHEIRRLQKCTGIARPCIVSIDGVEQGSPMRILATSIHWQD